MRQTFTVIVPSANLSLVPIGRMRAAAGLAVDDDSRDAELTALGEAISTDIAVACKVASDGLRPPTLLQETVAETFWLYDREPDIFLSRLLVSSIASAAEAGSALIPSDWVLNAGAGMISRVSFGRPSSWCAGSVELTYTAGLAAVPADLAEVVVDIARLRLAGGDRDPLVKSESIEIPDVQTRRTDYWVGPLPGSAAGPIPAEYVSRLGRYMNVLLP
ncbi:UNVERIFIED_ORG: hypothetical protein LHK14_18000 [Roseateles sp. XES5]|nr:hypothetical protein [Roseateles sp. XES5]